MEGELQGILPVQVVKYHALVAVEAERMRRQGLRMRGDNFMMGGWG